MLKCSLPKETSFAKTQTLLHYVKKEWLLRLFDRLMALGNTGKHHETDDTYIDLLQNCLITRWSSDTHISSYNLMDIAYLSSLLLDLLMYRSSKFIPKSISIYIYLYMYTTAHLYSTHAYIYMYI